MAKSIYPVLVILFLTSVSAYPQDRNTRLKKVSLSGTITDDKTGETLPGATVYLADDRVGVTADHAGHYTLHNLPSGHHIVEVSHTGYATRVDHLEINNDTIVDFRLSSVIVENQGVIVTGVSGATSIRKAPIPVSALRRSDLMQTASTNIIDVLTKIPGVSQLSTGPAISKPFIRGLGFNRVIVVNEGVRQEGQQWGDEHGIEIDEMSVGRAEVLKGPASLMYGSDALAGVINFITHTPVAEGTVRGNVLGQYQSNQRLYAMHVNIAGNRNGFNWNFYGTYKSAGDYKNAFDGRVLNSRFNENNFGGYVGLNKNWGFSHLVFSRFNQETGLVEGDRDPLTGKFILYAGTPLEKIASEDDLGSRDILVPFQRVIHNRLISDNNFVAGKSRIKLNLAYQENTRKEYGNPEDPAETELFFDLKTINYSLQWQLPEMKEWHTSIGANGMGQWNANKGSEVLIPEYDLFDLGLFIHSQRFFERSTLSGGLRFDRRTLDSKELTDGSGVRFKAINRSFSNFSGSIGISHEASSKITLKANLATGFRAPTMAELSSNGTHEGTNRYEYGQPGLRSEKSLQGDLGTDFNYEHFNLGVSLFYNRVSDFIFYLRLLSVNGGDSLVNVDGEDIPAFKFSQQDAALKGFEMSLDLHPHPLDWLHFESRLSFVRGKFDEAVGGSVNLPMIPATRLSSEIRGDFPRTGKRFKNLYAKIELDYTFKQDKPFEGFSTETITPGYGLWNAGIGSDLQNYNKKKTILSVHIALQNITDKTYQNHLSRLKYAAVNEVSGRKGVFNAGRNFSIKVNFPLYFKN